MGLSAGVDISSDGDNILVMDPNTGILAKIITEANFPSSGVIPPKESGNFIDVTDFGWQGKINNYRELVLPNPYPQQANAPVHPSVLYFEDGWQGFKYWMAFTPYPGYNSAYENPSVIASNDLKTFVEPAPNPIIPPPSGGYNADCHLFMAPDNSRMYMAYRERNVNNYLKVCHTTDGKTWSTPVSIAQGVVATTDFASPSIWWNGTGWTCISHQLDAAAPWPVRRMVSSTADIYGAWGAASNITVAPFSGRAWWHSFIVRLPSNQVIGIFQDNNQTVGGSGQLYLAESADDGITFNVITPVANGGGRYRSTFNFRRAVDGVLVDLIFSDFASIKLYHSVLPSGAKVERQAKVAKHFAAIKDPSNLHPGVILVDSCTRADNAASPGNADSGQAWVVSSGTWGILTNRINCTASGRLTFAAGVPNHSIAAVFTDFANGGQQYLMVRLVDTSNYWRIGVGSGLATGASNLILQNVVAAAIGTVNKVIGSVQRGDLISAEAIGKAIRVYVNGLCVHEEECITSSTGTSVGLQANGSANALYRNIVIANAAIY